MFYITFSKSSHTWDLTCALKNFTGNAAAIAVASALIAVICNVALKALGFSPVATLVATAIPATLAMTGTVSAVAGGICLLSMVCLSHRPFGGK